MASKIVKAEFVAGATAPGHFPGGKMPEVAFAGRSNVGKSSLINRLANRKNLAKTSSTPGRTRQINFFNINDLMLFVDLPGYGFAKVSKQERDSWGKLVSSYMAGRETLKAVVAILDIRRDPSSEDMQLFEMIYNLGIPPICALTKADKIKRGQTAGRRRKIAEKLDMEAADLILFSSVTGQGKQELWKALLEKI